MDKDILCRCDGIYGPIYKQYMDILSTTHIKYE